VSIIEPKLGYSVVIRLVLISRNGAPMALNESTKSWDSSADWAVDILPITKELIVRHARFLRDAVNDFEHAQW